MIPPRRPGSGDNPESFHADPRKRHGERRLASLEEANAIGTSWLQARAIDSPHAAAVARILE
ncbi:MAG: hypothetical protein IOC73_12275, partial [Rhodobacter sp.]|nr:hypothetical protein [Rhodobacter sp.]MCA3552597.1 hypothetical protein [Rhodobacter sp.]